jgi:hypothetical protein
MLLQHPVRDQIAGNEANISVASRQIMLSSSCRCWRMSTCWSVELRHRNKGLKLLMECPLIKASAAGSSLAPFMRPVHVLQQGASPIHVAEGRSNISQEPV